MLGLPAGAGRVSVLERRERRRARREARAREQIVRPGRVLVGAFGIAVVLGTALLMLPVATAEGEAPHPIDALFTATTAVCVTGLVVVDTGGYWSTFGELVILALMQIGGLGIMTLGTLLALVLSRRLGLRGRLLIAAETKTLRLQDVRHVVRAIVIFAFVTEAVIAAILAARFALAYDFDAGRAIYHGIFHAISAFNSAGLSLNADSFVRYAGDPLVCLPLCAAAILGGIGYLVVFELSRSWRRPRTWSVLTRITLAITAALLVIGTALITAAEWTNPRTFGDLSVGDSLLAGFFAAVMPRSAGLNSVDTSAMTEESLLVQIILMFIGGGSASTAGGIKVTTFGLLAFVIWAEMRGEARVHVGRRAIPPANQRQALAIALLGVGIVVTATLTLLALTEEALLPVLYEATSAFGTVGLSTGITPALGRDGHLVIIALMFAGRIGPLTLASALALRDHGRRYELPEERTPVG